MLLYDSLLLSNSRSSMVYTAPTRYNSVWGLKVGSCVAIIPEASSSLRIIAAF